MLTRCKRALALFAAFLLCVSLRLPALSEEEETEAEAPAAVPARILVLYPKEGDRRDREDTVSAVAQVLLSLQLKADYAEWRGAAGLENYERVIWCDTDQAKPMDTAVLDGYEGWIFSLGRGDVWEEREENDGAAEKPVVGKAAYRFPEGETYSASVTLLSPARFEEADYTAGTVQTAEAEYPLVCGKGRVRCLSLADYASDFAKAVLTQEIAQWLWPYDSRMHTYTEYVVLDQVYPFADPYRLQRVVKYLADLKMSFVISVMPIYEHADYPAMETFCEVLRYAQRNGGSVILCAPLIQGSPDAETIMDRITLASRNYMDHGVYPLALEIPCEWVLREDKAEILRRYRTLFLRDMAAMAAYPIDDYGLGDYFDLGFQQITPALKLNESGVSQIARCSTAVYVDFSSTEEEQIFAAIDAVKDSPIPVQDLWGLASSVFLDQGHVLTWDRNTLLVDGKQRFRTEEWAKTEEAFDYKRNVYYRVIADLSRENGLLIGMSAALLVLFLFLGISSRRQMRSRFLVSKPRGDGEQKKEAGHRADG